MLVVKKSLQISRSWRTSVQRIEACFLKNEFRTMEHLRVQVKPADLRMKIRQKYNCLLEETQKMKSFAELEYGWGNDELITATTDERLELSKLSIRVQKFVDNIESTFHEPRFCKNCFQFGHSNLICGNQTAEKIADAKYGRIKRRAAFLEWLLVVKQNTNEICPMLLKLEFIYENGSPFHAAETFEEYKKGFCLGVAAVYEECDTKLPIDKVSWKIDCLRWFYVCGVPFNKFMLPIVRALDFD